MKSLTIFTLFACVLCANAQFFVHQDTDDDFLGELKDFLEKDTDKDEIATNDDEVLTYIVYY